MFQEYYYMRYLGFDTDSNLERYKYKIIDDEFGELIENALGVIDIGGGAEIGFAIIDVYEKRNLNVAANLAMGFKYMNCIYKSNIVDIIKFNNRYNSRYHKYAADVEKYLIWM